MLRTGSLAGIALLIAGGAVLAPPFAASAGEDEPGGRRRFEDSLVVREVEVRFDLSVLPPLESIGRRGAGDFVLIEQGATRPTLRFDSDPDRDGWELLVWLDDGLADGRARAVAARSLAVRAAELVEHGPVELVEADDGIVSLGSTTSAVALADRLVQAARRAERSPATTALDSWRAAARLDRLSVAIAARQGGGARVLLLPLSSWQVDAPWLDELGRARSGAVPTPRVRPLVEAARTLAGYGWVTLGLALRPVSELTRHRLRNPETAISTGPGGDQRTFVPSLRLPFRRDRPLEVEQAALDSAVDLGMIPAGDLVRPGSGAIAAHDSTLDELLERLFSRASLVATAPESPPGQLLARRVLWTGGDGRPLPVLSLARASTPPEVAAARLRRALGGAPGGSLDPRIAVDRAAGEMRVCLAPGVERGWVRLSSARTESGLPALTIGSPLELRRPAAAQGVDAAIRTDCAAWPEAAARDSARLVEDLDRETWAVF